MAEPRSERDGDAPADELLDASRRHVKEAKNAAESREWRLGAEQPPLAEEAHRDEGTP